MPESRYSMGSFVQKYVLLASSMVFFMARASLWPLSPQPAQLGVAVLELVIKRVRTVRTTSP